MPQKAHVPRMQQIKDAVREHDDSPRVTLRGHEGFGLRDAECLQGLEDSLMPGEKRHWWRGR